MEEGHDAPAPAGGFTDTLTDDVVAYRPVSPAAVLGLVLAVVSTLALASRWFAFVPVVAALVSWAAARRVRANADSTSGFGLAATGLVLSLLVLGAVVVQRPFAQRLHGQSAEVVERAFLAKLREADHVGAHELTVPFSERRPTPELAAVYYEANGPAGLKLAEFAERPAVARLAGAGDPEFLERSEVGAPRSGRLSMIAVYRVPADDSRPEVGLKLRMERPASASFGPLAWRVAEFDTVPLVD